MSTSCLDDETLSESDKCLLLSSSSTNDECSSCDFLSSKNLCEGEDDDNDNEEDIEEDDLKSSS